MQNLLCSPSCHTVPNIFYTPLSNINLTLMLLCSSTGCKSDLEQNPSTAPSPWRPGVIWLHVGFRQVLFAYCSPFSCSAHPTVSFAGTHLSLLELCLPTRVLPYRSLLSGPYWQDMSGILGARPAWLSGLITKAPEREQAEESKCQATA